MPVFILPLVTAQVIQARRFRPAAAIHTAGIKLKQAPISLPCLAPAESGHPESRPAPPKCHLQHFAPAASWVRLTWLQPLTLSKSRDTHLGYIKQETLMRNRDLTSGKPKPKQKAPLCKVL